MQHKTSFLRLQNSAMRLLRDALFIFSDGLTLGVCASIVVGVVFSYLNMADQVFVAGIGWMSREESDQHHARRFLVFSSLF